MTRSRRSSTLSSTVIPSTRQRRHSIVERIASSTSIPSHETVEDTLSIHHLKKDTSTHKQPLLISKKETLEYVDALLFPLTNHEIQTVTDSFLDQFQYQVLTTDSQPVSKYQIFIDSCSFRQRQYAYLLEQSNSIISDLGQLTLSYDTVSHDTELFQSEANSLISQYEKYSTLNGHITETLAIYERLDPITRRLNNPNPNIVRKSSFHDLLVELDHCLATLRESSEHKDSALYVGRFKRCQVRALTMVRNYVINQIRSVGAEILAKQAQSNEITKDALIYTRFTEDLLSIKDIVSELCSRVNDDDEYANLFNDCLHAYYGVRWSLISAILKEHFQGNDSMGSLTQFAQNGITFLERLFHSEVEVYSTIFTSQSQSISLTTWFEELADPFYDSLRLRILREASISNLCGLISLLEKYYEYDEDELKGLLGEEDPNYEPQPTSAYKMSEVLLPILQDTQTRLIFRIQCYIADQITHYKPQASDFQISQRKNSVSSSPTAIPSFPPLDKALLLISRIYGHIPSQVFTSLTHTVTHDLIHSLTNTSKQAISKYIGSLEGELWQIRELLRLNQSLSQYEFDMDGYQGDSDTVIDFSGTLSFIKGIFNQEPIKTGRRTSAWDIINETIPKVKTEYRDSRIELQAALAKLVENFDSEAVKIIMVSLNNDDAMMEFRDTIMLTYSHLYDLVGVYLQEVDDSDGMVCDSLIDSVSPVLIKAYADWLDTVDQSYDMMDVDGVGGFIEGVVLRVDKLKQQQKQQQQDS